jgi:hypothetical protein
MKNHKLFSLCLGLLLLNIPLSACVFSDYKNVYIFGINLLRSPQYANYFYNSPYSEDACLPGNEKNITAWQQQYPSIKNLDFFHEFIYKAELQEVQKVYNSLESGKNPFPKNEFVAYLLQKKDKEALAYLVFAKKCEPFVVNRFGWEDTPQVNAQSIEDLLNEGEETIKSLSNDFLKQRYIFQLVRLAYYHTAPENTIKLFDELTLNNQKNYIYYRTLLHKAFALKKAKKNSEANVIFAEVFSNSEDLRCLAFKNLAVYKNNEMYSGIDEEIWAATIEKTTNPDLRAALYLLRASSEQILNPAFLKNSFTNGATVEQLEVMLLRQIKMAETNHFLPSLQQAVVLDSAALTYGDAVSVEVIQSKGFFSRIWESIVNFFKGLFGSKKSEIAPQKSENPPILTAQVYGDPIVDNAKNIADNPELKLLEETAIAIAEKYKDNNAIFYLGTAYLQIMRGKYGLAKSSLESANKTAAKMTSLQDQTIYLETLLAVLQSENIDSNTEDIVAKNTAKLWKNVAELNNGWQRLLLFSELGRKYLKQGDLAKAVLAFKYCKQYDVAGMLLDFYCSQTDLDNYLAFIKGNPDTEIKKLFWRELPQNDVDKTNFVKDLQATKLMREGKFAVALTKFKEIEPAYWNGKEVKTYDYKPLDPNKEAQKTVWGSVMLGVGESDNFYYGFSSECEKISTNFSAPERYVAKNDTFSNKMMFLEKLVELETKAQATKGDEAAKLYIEMANGMNHTPFWLYNNAVWHCGGMLDAMRNSYPTSYPFNINSQFATQFHNRKMHVVLTYCIPYLSAVYYKKAAEIAQTKDLKANALFYQGNVWTNSLASYWEDGIKQDLTPFQLLQQQYADTKQAAWASACLK